MKGKRVGSVLGDLLKKEKKGPRAGVEIEIEPLDEMDMEDDLDEMDADMEEMEMERLDSAKRLLGMLGVDGADDDMASEFAAELENFLSLGM